MKKLFFALSVFITLNTFAALYETQSYICQSSEGDTFNLEVTTNIDQELSFTIDGKDLDEGEIDVRFRDNGSLQLWFIGYPGADEQVNICTPDALNE